MNNPGGSETAALVAGLLIEFGDIRSVWSMDHEPAGTDGPRARARLVVFVDTATQSVPHVPGVEVLVVTDADALQRWAWRQTSESEAFYDEARWAEDGTTVLRIRRKAQLLWQSAQNAGIKTDEARFLLRDCSSLGAKQWPLESSSCAMARRRAPAPSSATASSSPTLR